MTDIQNVAVIGSGPAGMSAAIYLGRFNLQPLVFTGKLIGGEPTWTESIENYPGFPEGISGPNLSQKFFAQAEKFGAQIVPEIVTQLDCTNSPISLWTVSANDQPPDYQVRALIIATGGEPEKLNLPEEEKFLGHGLAFCALCDGLLYKNKIVGVVGSGNKTVEEAILLSRYAEKVYLIVRGNTLKADAFLQAQLQANQKIATIFSQQVTQLMGEEQLEQVLLQKTDGQKTQTLALQGLFLAIGQKPANQLFARQLALDKKGYLLTGAKAQFTTQAKNVTNVQNVFAAGDIVSGSTAQVAIAVGSGAQAAIEVRQFLNQENIN